MKNIIRDTIFSIRFWNKVNKSGDCWEWTAHTVRGYGKIKYKRKQYAVHRISMILSGTEIPSGMVVDHICRNKKCVKQDHLRVVSKRVNSIENSGGVSYINARKTHCIRGHEFSGYNLIKNKRGRACRTCARASGRAHYYRHRRKLPISSNYF